MRDHVLDPLQVGWMSSLGLMLGHGRMRRILNNIRGVLEYVGYWFALSKAPSSLITHIVTIDSSVTDASHLFITDSSTYTEAAQHAV